MTADQGLMTAAAIQEAPLVRIADGAVVATRCEVARTFGARFLGLMGRAALPAGGALWIAPCSSIHMMFMRFRIDAVFVDPDGRVLKVTPRVMPWLGMAACRGAEAVIELEAGAAERAHLAPGDVLVLSGAPPAKGAAQEARALAPRHRSDAARVSGPPSTGGPRGAEPPAKGEGEA